MLGIHPADSDIALQPLSCFFPGQVGRRQAPGAADNLLAPLVLIGAHDAVMNHHQSAAALKEFFQARALLADNLHSILRVDDEHVCALKMCRRRKIQGPINIHSALGQQLLPILKKSWMIVLVWTMGFDTGADEDAERGGGHGAGQQEGEKAHQARNPKAEARKKSKIRITKSHARSSRLMLPRT